MKIISYFLGIFFISAIQFAHAQEVTAFGTSFTFGEDGRPVDAFPMKLQEKLTLKGNKVTVYNFSQSGLTTVDLLNRVEKIPKESKVVIFEYAVGNDQRAGIKPDLTEKNAADAIRKILASNKKVILLLRGLHEDRLKALVERWTPFIKETGISYISIYQPPGKNAAPNKAYFHPTPEFHNEIADQLLGPVQILLGESK
jgi:Tfp pilus assembly protein PilZ